MTAMSLSTKLSNYREKLVREESFNGMNSFFTTYLFPRALSLLHKCYRMYTIVILIQKGQESH